jgi:hypothetical protein
MLLPYSLSRLDAWTPMCSCQPELLTLIPQKVRSGQGKIRPGWLVIRRSKQSQSRRWRATVESPTVETSRGSQTVGNTIICLLVKMWQSVYFVKTGGLLVSLSLRIAWERQHGNQLHPHVLIFPRPRNPEGQWLHPVLYLLETYDIMRPSFLSYQVTRAITGNHDTVTSAWLGHVYGYLTPDGN